jgi:hypothetical protein
VKKVRKVAELKERPTAASKKQQMKGEGMEETLQLPSFEQVFEDEKEVHRSYTAFRSRKRGLKLARKIR